MGVLKNDVGRPSNKTIKIRRILKLIGLVLVVGIAFFIGYKLSDIIDKENKYKEETKVVNIDISDAKKIMKNYFSEYYTWFPIHYSDNFENDATYSINYDNDIIKTLGALESSLSDKNYYDVCEEFECEVTEYGTYVHRDEITFDKINSVYDEKIVEKTFKQNYKTGKLYTSSIEVFCCYGKIYTNGKFYDVTSSNCGCGDGFTAPINDVYKAYKENNKLHIVMATIAVQYIDDSLKLILKDGTKLDYDYKKENQYILKYGNNMKQYELIFEINDGGYTFVTQKDLN